MATSLQRAMWDDQERRYGSPDYIQGLLDRASDLDAKFGSEPSFFERMRRQQDQMHGITPNPPSYKKPVDPSPTTPSWKQDPFLVASSDDDDLTLDYFLDQGEQMGISASSGLDAVIPLLVGAMSKFPGASNLAQTGMEYGYSLLPTFGKKGKLAVSAGALALGVPKMDLLAEKAIETLKDPVAQAGDYKKDQPGLIGTLLSQGENLGAKGNTTGIYGGVPQLLNLIDNIQGTGVQDLQGFLQGLGGILGVGEGDIENAKQAARDVDEDKFAGLYT